MVCRKCGELLDENARVCPVCGTRQMFDSTTKLNPTHTYAEDCAHEEEHQPRKRRTKILSQLLVGLILSLSYFLVIGLFIYLDLDLNDIIALVIVALFIISFISSIVNARRK